MFVGHVYAEPEHVHYEPTDSGFTEEWSDLTSDRDKPHSDLTLQNYYVSIMYDIIYKILYIILYNINHVSIYLIFRKGPTTFPSDSKRNMNLAFFMDFMFSITIGKGCIDI